MILNGNVKLSHQGHYDLALKEFDVDTFLGSYNTKCFGKCVDFNLIYNNKYDGHISTMDFYKNQNITYNIDDNIFHYGIYVVNGLLKYFKNKEEVQIEQGDYMYFVDKKNDKIQLTAKENSKILIIQIKKCLKK